MNEEAGFVAAMMADPTDETVRLVYADWLDERDDPRAAIVRSEVEIGRMERDPLDVFLLASARRKFAYRGWRRKYSSSWVQAVERTVIGEILHHYKSPLHEGERYIFHRFALVLGTVPQGLQIVRLEDSAWFPKHMAEKNYVMDCVVRPLFVDAVPLTFHLTRPPEVVSPKKNTAILCFDDECKNYPFVFWDGAGVTDDEVAGVLPRSPHLIAGRARDHRGDIDA